MPYQDFTFSKLSAKFGLEQKSVYLFKDILIESIEPTSHLVQDLQEAREMPTATEKARGEAIIAPIIKEIKRRNKHISIFSGYTFNVDAQNDLTGAPDFMISMKPMIIELENPIFCLVESKNKTPEDAAVGMAKVSFTRRMMSKYDRAGFTITMSAPSLMSRATSRIASSLLAGSIW